MSDRARGEEGNKNEVIMLPEEMEIALRKAVLITGARYEDLAIAVSFTFIPSSIRDIIEEQCFEIPTLKETKQHQNNGWYRKFEKKRF